MTQAAALSPVQSGANTPQTKLSFNMAVLEGRIHGKPRTINTQSGKRVLTLLKLKAADEFSSAQTVEVRSARSLGAIGDVVRIRVMVGGYGRNYEAKREDPETGEITRAMVNTAENSLTVVEDPTEA